MNCQKCGKVLNPGEKFCTNCGTVVAAPVTQVPVQPVPNQNVQSQVVQPQPMPVQQPQPQVMPTPQPNIVNQPQPAMQPQMPMNNMPGAQPMGGNQMPPEPKKNNTFIIIAAILGVIIIGLIIFLVVRSKGSDEGDVSGNTTENTQTTTETTNSNNNNDNNNNVSASATKYDGYEFSIPEKYTVQGEDSGLLVILDNSQQVKMGITIERSTSYNGIISDKESVVKAYENQGLLVSKNYEKSYGGKAWFVTELSLSNGYGLIAHTALDNYTLMLFITSTTNSTINFDSILTDFSKVVSTAKSGRVSGFANSDKTVETEAAKFKNSLN